MTYKKQDYEKLSESLQTSEELLYAIEQMTGKSFEFMPAGDYCPWEDDNVLAKNTASELWENGGRTDEILAALPVDSAEEGDEVFWGAEGKFAEFDGEKWGRADA